MNNFEKELIDSIQAQSELGQAISGAVYANAAFEVANTAYASPIMLEPLSGLTITQNYTIPNNYRGVSRGAVTKGIASRE